MEATQKQIDAVLKYIFDPSESNAKRLKRCKVNKEELDKFIQTRKILKLVQQLKQEGGNPLRSLLRRRNQVYAFYPSTTAEPENSRPTETPDTTQVVQLTEAKIKTYQRRLIKYLNPTTGCGIMRRDPTTTIVNLIAKLNGNLNFVYNKQFTPLKLAIRSGCESSKIEIVETLLKNGANPNYPEDPIFYTALDIAIQEGNLIIVTLLLNHGAYINGNDNVNSTYYNKPLHVAVQKGNIEILKALLDREGINVNITGGKEYTALHLALMKPKPNIDIINILIRKGADITITSHFNGTTLSPLSLALYKSPEILNALLNTEQQVDISHSNLRDNTGNTLLHVLVLKDKSEYILELLRKRNITIDINAANNNGDTPLHLAVSKDNKELIVVLISAGANINAANNNGYTPLHLAVSKDNKELIVVFISAGANINAANKNGDTPLHLALKGYTSDEINMNIVKALLAAEGIDVNKPNKNGDTPLHFATYHTDYESVKALLTAGANVNVANNYNNETPLHLVFSKTHPSSENNDVTILKIIRALLNKGANVNARSINGQTPVHLALMMEHLTGKIIEGLLKPEYNPDVNIQDEEGLSPLYFACINGNTDLMQKLLDHGANVNAINNAGNAPIHLAASKSAKILETLLATEGIDVNKANIYGETPLHIAVIHDKFQNVKALLLLANANVNVQDIYGNTPLHIAFHNKENLNSNIVRALIKKGADINKPNKKNVTPNMLYNSYPSIEEYHSLSKYFVKDKICDLKTIDQFTSCTCPICFDDFNINVNKLEDPNIKNNNISYHENIKGDVIHAFHKSCLDKAFANKKECPLCKESLTRYPKDPNQNAHSVLDCYFPENINIYDKTEAKAKAKSEPEPTPFPEFKRKNCEIEPVQRISNLSLSPYKRTSNRRSTKSEYGSHIQNFDFSSVSP